MPLVNLSYLAGPPGLGARRRRRAQALLLHDLVRGAHLPAGVRHRLLLRVLPLRRHLHHAGPQPEAPARALAPAASPPWRRQSGGPRGCSSRAIRSSAWACSPRSFTASSTGTGQDYRPGVLEAASVLAWMSWAWRATAGSGQGPPATPLLARGGRGRLLRAHHSRDHLALSDLVLVGVNHKKTPVELRECLAFADAGEAALPREAPRSEGGPKAPSSSPRATAWSSTPSSADGVSRRAHHRRGHGRPASSRGTGATSSTSSSARTPSSTSSGWPRASTP